MNELVDACYAAAAEPDLWPVVLDRVSTAVGALGLVVMNQYDPEGIVASRCFAEANEAYMADDWWQIDPRNSRGKAMDLRADTLILDRDLFAPDEQQRDPFFQDFSARYDLGEFAAYVADDPAGGKLTVGAFRSGDDGSYGMGEIDHLRRIGPHVARAYILTNSLAHAKISAGNAATALEHARVGLVTLDERGRVQQVNAIAERLLPGYLRLDADRHLRAVLPSEREKLDRQIASTLPTGAGGIAGPLLLKGSDGRRPLSVEVVPLRGVAAAIGSFGRRHGGVLVMLRDLLAVPSKSIEPQLQQVGLTPAEARVAMLIGRGKSPSDVADQLEVSSHTVRVQLRSIFMKLGINRQSELAIMIARLDCISG